MNIIKFTAVMLSFASIVGISFAQETPPQGCNVDDDKMGRGEIRQCIVRSTGSPSRLVIENRHGTISAYINLNTMLRDDKTLVMRWDDEKAVTTAMTRSTDFKAMFFGNAHSAISKIAKTKTLMVESETYQRGTSVDTFTISNGEEMANYVLKRTSSQPVSTTSVGPTPDKLVQDLQTALNQRGFNAGSEDGYMGQQTQAAIIAAQRSLGLNANGLPSQGLLSAIKAMPAQDARSRDSQRALNQLTGEQSQAPSADGYAARIRACVRPGVTFSAPPRSGSVNSTVAHRVTLHPDGLIADIKLTRSSGNSNFDRAVETGIRQCAPFPRPSSGSYPGYMDIYYSMYD